MYVWRLLQLDAYNGYWNMALDEAILESVIAKKAPFSLRLYKWNPSTISIGRNQSLSDEVHIDIAQKNGFNLVRRITGGGAVFHDFKREITYSVVCSIKFLENLNAQTVLEQFELIEKGIITALNNYGLKPEKGIIHCPAIFIDGKKFSGNAQARRKNYILQHGTILLELDAELMYSVLKAPNNVSKSRMVKSVHSKCIGVKEKIENYSELKLVNALKTGFEKVLKINLKEGGFTDFEMELARKLVRNRYSTIKWLYKYG